MLGATAAFFLAWTDGSNNAADAIGTAVGARIISLKKALIIASVSDFAGAVLFGPFIAKTIMGGIVTIGSIPNPQYLLSGMIAALFATAIMELISSILKIPMPVTVGIVISIMTFGLISSGVESIDWRNLTWIFTSWIILPFFSGLLALVLYKAFRRGFNIPKFLPLISGSSAFILAFSVTFLLLYKAVGKNALLTSITASTGLGVALGAFLWLYSKKILKEGDEGSERVIKLLMVIAMSSLAFSHGANDVGKAAGPLTAVAAYIYSGGLGSLTSVGTYALLFSALGIATGIATWGYRVVGTIGEEITTLSYVSAFTAQLASALSVLIMTRLGMPVSTTQAIVGAVAGVGLASGYRTVNLKTLAKIFITWGIAIPVSAALTAIIYNLLLLS